MASRRTPTLFLSLLALVLFVTSCSPGTGAAADGTPVPTPAPWPEQFHALLYTNLSNFGKIRVDGLWYDWPNRRNMLVTQTQLRDLLYDVEWDNGTSFYFTLAPHPTCRTMRFPVGVVRPDFLQEGAAYLGRAHADGFLCDLWQKLDFIWYYEDVATRRPVRWDFYDGISMHVMTFEVGAVLEDSHWQAPVYCFQGDGDGGGGEEDEARLSGLAEVHRRLRFLGHHGGDALQV